MDDTSQPIPQHTGHGAQPKLGAVALTDPMTTEEVAKIWGFNRRKMLVILRAMKDAGEAIQHGHHWRIRIYKMPHKWLIKHWLPFVQDGE